MIGHLLAERIRHAVRPAQQEHQGTALIFGPVHQAGKFYGSHLLPPFIQQPQIPIPLAGTLQEPLRFLRTVLLRINLLTRAEDHVLQVHDGAQPTDVLINALLDVGTLHLADGEEDDVLHRQSIKGEGPRNKGT